MQARPAQCMAFIATTYELMSWVCQVIEKNDKKNVGEQKKRNFERNLPRPSRWNNSITNYVCFC